MVSDVSTPKLSFPLLAWLMEGNGFRKYVRVPYHYSARASFSLLLILLGSCEQ